MLVDIIIAFVISAVITSVAGYKLIPALHKRSAVQSIREDGPVWHKSKQGTPTMGGVMFIIGITAACLTEGFLVMRRGEFNHIYILVFAILFAMIGFLDDYKKFTKKQNLGLTAMHKSILQLFIAISFTAFMHIAGILSAEIYIPFFEVSLPVPLPVYYVFSVFVIIGTVNSVNITDGADGLATGVTIPVAVCMTAAAYLLGYTSLAVFAAALTGGLAAFLFFNFHPAKVFMGDTGSLFLGGAVCAMAFAIDMPLLLILLGFVYFVETLSDIIQVSYYKITKGKRVFKMAPIHHHFEMCGWSEYKLFTVFTTVSALFAGISLIAVFMRYA